MAKKPGIVPHHGLQPMVFRNFLVVCVVREGGPEVTNIDSPSTFRYKIDKQESR